MFLGILYLRSPDKALNMFEDPPQIQLECFRLEIAYVVL